jgi:hypothetical protein
MTTSVPVKTSKKQTVVRKDLLKVRVASHFSRAGATPEPTGQPASGKRDPAEQRRWGAGKPVIGATVSVQRTKASAITDKGGRATLDLGGVLGRERARSAGSARAGGKRVLGGPAAAADSRIAAGERTLVSQRERKRPERAAVGLDAELEVRPVVVHHDAERRIDLGTPFVLKGSVPLGRPSEAVTAEAEPTLSNPERTDDFRTSAFERELACIGRDDELGRFATPRPFAEQAIANRTFPLERDELTGTLELAAARKVQIVAATNGDLGIVVGARRWLRNAGWPIVASAFRVLADEPRETALRRTSRRAQLALSAGFAASRVAGSCAV